MSSIETLQAEIDSLQRAIDALDAELGRLGAEFANRRPTKSLEIAMQNRMAAMHQDRAAMHNRMAAMIGRLPPQALPARAERSVPYSTPHEFASRWKHEPLQLLPANHVLLDPQVKDTVGRLREALQKLKKSAPESAVQKAFTKNLCGPTFKFAEPAENRVVLNTAPSTVFADDRTGECFKPDLVVATSANHDVGGYLAVIELKSGDMALPTPECAHVRQVTNYLDVVLRHQPSRPWIYGVLTNGQHCCVIKAFRVGSVAATFAIVYNGDYDAGQWIAWLLTQTRQVLGYGTTANIDIPGCNEPLTLLGGGQFCLGYSTIVAGEQVVVKYYPDAVRAEHERRMYKKLRGVPGTTQLHATQVASSQKDAPHYVVVTPRGHHFDTADYKMTQAHAEMLVTALRSMHELGVCHRDVCDANVFWVSPDAAVINDFSHAEVLNDVRSSDWPYNINDDCHKLSTILRPHGYLFNHADKSQPVAPWQHAGARRQRNE